MKQFIGTKVIQAEPAWRITSPNGKQYVVEKDPNLICAAGSKLEDGYKVVYSDGYESWSPKDVFEAAYRETAGMSNIERILYGDKEALVNELHDIVKWAREMNNHDWYDITHDVDGGLHGVLRRIVEGQVNNHGTAKAEENKIFGICIQVAKITAEEIAECREIARGQREYMSPLRPATTRKQNDLGEHNDAVLDALLKLKEVIESGANLSE